MLFRKGKFYTHINMLDTNIKVKLDPEIKEDYIRLFIGYYNKNGMDINESEFIYVSKHELSKWYEVKEKV